MSRLLCCLRARRHDMGAALSHPQEGEACDGGVLPASPPTMADVIRERKKKAGSAGLGTLRRRIAAAARRPRESRPDRGCEHARFIRSVVSSWRLAEVFLLCEELEGGAALRDLVTQAELAREPAAALHADLAALLADRVWCDVELVGCGWSLAAHRVVLAARCTYFRDLLMRSPKSAAVRLDGAAAALRREEGEALLRTLYAGAAPQRCAHCRKWERGASSEAELDIINVENTSTYRRGCTCTREAAAVRRLAGVLGFTADALHRDMKYLLDSGELCDARLSWRSESGAAYGFRSALELPCHTLLLAARSRFFRSVMSRRAGAGVCGAGNAGGAVCVDEKVLPRRFAPALLHAAYTDQVDLTLIGRSSSSPSSTTSTTSSSVTRSGSRSSVTALLDDAFQLYEIATFLEMPIAVQGSEDAIVFALSADTLPHVLRWCAAPHASAWVRRQAMRYLRDEFPAIMSSSAAARLSSSAVGEVLASPFLQASEAQALRALLRWAERAAEGRESGTSEPNVVWHTAHSGRRARGRSNRRDLTDRAVRDALLPLAPLLRAEHLPPDCPLLHQAVRRGLLPAPAEGACSADAWLGRGAFRPPRCFLPYLDEIKALLEDQAVPEAEVALIRRARYLQRIPDTLYMVRDIGPPRGGSSQEGVRACIPPRVLARVRGRVRELRATPGAARALSLHQDTRPVHRQIALRAVREMSLPDACADLLLADDSDSDREGVYGEGEGRATEGRRAGVGRECDVDCCRSSAGSLRCSTGSLRSTPSLHASHTPHTPATLHHPLDKSRSNACRRELPARPDSSRSSGVSGGRLSLAVPDVAMAPNGNTHLLTPHYPHTHAHAHAHPHTHAQAHAHAHAYAPQVGGAAAGHAPTHAQRVPPPHDEYGGVVQLDLGDGATHTPRPGSRAQRARPYREHAQGVSCVRSRAEEDELRVAIELSVIRAYGSLQANRRADLLPNTDFAALRRGASPARSGASLERSVPAHARTLSVSGSGAGAGAERACASERASPARDYAERHGGASYSRASCSRTHSPAYTS